MNSEYITVGESEVSITVPTEGDVAFWLYNRSSAFRTFVEYVFDQRGRELSRWSLKGMLDEFAGETVDIDRSELFPEGVIHARYRPRERRL